MASTVSTGSLSDEERRWIVVGVCLTKVIPPALRNVLAAQLQNWYNLLCQPPDEIDKQDFTKYKKRKLPASRSQLQYKNINNNDVHRFSIAYDYAVKDPLSLAKLFVRPFMAKFTGFDDTMDLSAIFAVMCNANPFSSAAVDAEKVRSNIRNKWAHCNFSEWTQPVFTASIQGLKLLIKKINLSPTNEKALCDDLDDWEKKGLGLCFGQPVTELITELRTSVIEALKFESGAEMKTVKEELDNLKSKMEAVEKRAAENSKGVKRHSDQLECHSNQLECHSNKLECHSNKHECHSNELERHSNQLECHSNELKRHSNELKHLTKQRRTEDHDKQKENYSEFAVKKVPYGLRKLPRGMVERPSEVNQILGLLMEGNNKVGVVGSLSGEVIGIRGMGGLGKTVLAQAVALDASKSRQVIWLDIGETPDRLALINILIKVLGGAASFSDIRAAQAWLIQNTSDKDCLVVLDDVWHVDDAAVFDHLSGRCQLLITTRDANVVGGLGGSAYELETMAADQSQALLYKYACVTPDEQSKLSSNMQGIVSKLLDQCGGLPLALSLVGSNLKDTRDEQAWRDILQDFEKADLEKLRSLFPTDAYPHRNLLAAINVSFQRLEESAREKFLDFAIFPEDTDIPSDILELFWSSIGTENGRISCNPRESREKLTLLERKSLIQKGPELQGKTSYRVHDLLLDFARAKRRATGTLTDVQRVFVRTLRGQCVNGKWTTTSSTYHKDYYFNYLPYHLYSSEQHGKLLQLFFDFHWLEQKVKKTNFPSLISDFRFLKTPLEHEIKLLKKSLMLSAATIVKNPNYIGPQLLGRLLSYIDECPRVKKLLEHVRETCGKTYHLLPLFSCLKLEGPEIFKKKFNSNVWSLATSNSPNGTIVISGLGNGSIHIHELDTGKELKILEEHTDRVLCLALSHSGKTLASGSFDDTTRLWNIDSYEQLFVLQRGGCVNALDFSADDQRLFTGSGDGKLRVWLVGTGELLDVIPAHDVWITSLCTTKDGLYVATTAFDDHTIKLWKADTLNIEATLVGHTAGECSVVAAGNDNPMLVSASGDKTLKIWDVKTKQEIRTLSGHKGRISSVAVSSDTKHIISGDVDAIVRLWCFHTGKLLSCFEGHICSISSVAITSDGSKALSGSDDRSFRVWDLDSSVYLKQDRSRGHSETVIDIAVTHDGSRCASASIDGTFKIWKCGLAAEECFTLKDKERAAKVAISADDRHVVSLSKDSSSSSIKVWDLLDGSEIIGTELDNTANLVRFSSDGRLVIIGNKRGRVFIWDWQNDDVKCVTLPSSFDTTEITCDGNMIYTCSENMEVCQIDLGSLKVSLTFLRQGPMVVLPDGKAILSGVLTDSSFIYWEPSTHREIEYNAGHSDDSIVTAIDITLNGKLAVSGSSSGTISLMNLESSKLVQTLGKTEGGVGIRLVSVLDDTRFVFVDEANRIELRTFNNKEAGLVLDQPAVKVTCITTHGVDYVLLGCENGELLLFNVHFKEYKYKYQAHSEAVSQVKSDPNGFLHYFVSGSASGCVKLWYVSKTVPPLWSQIWSHDNVYRRPITALAFVPHSADIVIGSYGYKVYRINAAGIVRTYQFDGCEIAALRVVEDSLIAAWWDRDCTGCVTRVAVKWSLNEELKSERISDYLLKKSKVKRVNNASNHVAYIVLDKNSLLIWNFKTGKTLCRVPLHPHYSSAFDITVMTFVPGDEFLLSSSDYDNTLKLWNIRNGRFVEEFHFDHPVKAIACASNGMVCVGLENGRVCFLRFNLPSHSGQLEQ